MREMKNASEVRKKTALYHATLGRPVENLNMSYTTGWPKTKLRNQQCKT